MPPVVANLTKIFLAQAKKRGAVELCIASDEIVRMRNGVPRHLCRTTIP